MFIATLLATAILTQSDIGALRSSKLVPNATNAIGAIVDERPVVLARATYATYTAVATGITQIMSFVFPGGMLQPGDMIQVSVGGTAVNNSGGAQQVGAQAVITQGITAQTFGYAANAPSLGAAAFAWRSEILLTTGIPGANGAYLGPRLNAVSPPERSTLPNAALSFTGWGDTLISGNTLAGTLSGGFVQNTVGAATGGILAATTTQVNFSNSGPIEIDVMVIGGLGASVISVMSGFMMGL